MQKKLKYSLIIKASKFKIQNSNEQLLKNYRYKLINTIKMRRRQSSGNVSQQRWMKNNYVETTKVFTPNFSDSTPFCKVNKQLAIPTIELVARQNQFLTQQTQKIANDMEKLASLGEYLVAENARMRMHYLQRNRDVQNIMTTMQLNLTHETDDIQHQMHLLRESNCLAFKNIQMKKAEIEEYSNRISEINKKMLETKENNTVLHQKILNPLKVRLQNKLNSNFIHKLNKQVEQLIKSEENLLKQVLQLTAKVQKLKNANQSRGKTANQQNFQNRQEKDQMKNDIVHALKTLVQLKEERQALDTAARKQEELNEELKIKNEKLMEKYKESVTIKEKKNMQISQLKFQRENQLNKIQQNKKKITEMQVKRMTTDEEKQKIIKLITQKKRKIQQNRKKQQAMRQAYEAQFTAKVTEFRKNIDQCEHKGEVQTKALKKQSEEIEHAKQIIDEEYRHISADYDNYEQMVNKLQNPIEEIQRAQLLLKLQKSRGALRSVSNNL